MKKLLGLVAAVGMSCLAPAIASATMIDFGFTTHGETDGTVVTTTSTAVGNNLSLPGSWSLGATFDDTPSWSLTDGGSNSLSGTVSWTDTGKGYLNGLYAITGGTGLFVGATGSGASFVVSIVNWYTHLPEWFEAGTLQVNTPNDIPQTVPEPSTTGLAALGLALVGLAAFRRRRVDVTRS